MSKVGGVTQLHRDLTCLPMFKAVSVGPRPISKTVLIATLTAVISFQYTVPILQHVKKILDLEKSSAVSHDGTVFAKHKL